MSTRLRQNNLNSVQPCPTTLKTSQISQMSKSLKSVIHYKISKTKNNELNHFKSTQDVLAFYRTSIAHTFKCFLFSYCCSWFWFVSDSTELHSQEYFSRCYSHLHHRSLFLFPLWVLCMIVHIFLGQSTKSFFSKFWRCILTLPVEERSFGVSAPPADSLLPLFMQPLSHVFFAPLVCPSVAV